MTIEKGGAWGEPVDSPIAADRVSSEQQLADAAAGALAGGRHARFELAEGMLGSDVARTLGIDRIRAPDERLSYVFDLGFVELDESRRLPFVAHAIAHRRFWSGEFGVIMNCAWHGARYLGPRSHPNDGLLDVTLGALDIGQRILARGRVKTGSHLPHPDLSVVRRASWSHRFDRPIPVFVDGRGEGRVRSIRAWIEADCFTVIV